MEDFLPYLRIFLFFFKFQASSFQHCWHPSYQMHQLEMGEPDLMLILEQAEEVTWTSAASQTAKTGTTNERLSRWSSPHLILRHYFGDHGNRWKGTEGSLNNTGTKRCLISSPSGAEIQAFSVHLYDKHIYKGDSLTAETCGLWSSSSEITHLENLYRNSVGVRFPDHPHPCLFFPRK